ncbi:unnamed protein product [Lactuca saligna]|uniref:Uncharacterized protein n=1 Tax=Lactuca saligna TaxID=75948 RepID=A0AA36A0Y9_LACSI|nr:unnamed protein product [Lactuca saligna]
MRKARDAELNENQSIVKEVEDKEKAEKEAQATLKRKMLLFLKWTLKQIQHDVMDLPSQYWLDPVASFDLQSSQDLQLDLPITPKPFKFCAFVKVVNAPIIDSGANHMLFSFYLKHKKPQYETWCAKKIAVLKVTRPIETDSFPNANFKVARCSDSRVYKFTLADFPCLNPYDWIVLYKMLREKEKYEPVMSHLQLMIKSYIQEVGEMDVDIATVLRKKPTTVTT